MKSLSLNAWGASQGQLFFDFIKEQAKNTDIFCFQEIFSAKNSAPQISSGAHMRLFEELEEMLPEFQGIFCERSSGYDFSGRADFPVRHGLASFIRNNIRIKNSQTLPIGPASLEIQTDPVEGVPKAQVFNLAIGKKELSVVNYHGPALPGNKLDTPERIGNSQELKAIWEDLSAPAKILGGDFNLMPDTESIKILEGCGKNLIREFKIENTRNEISWKKYHNKQSFADFAFVSSAVKLKNFEVPYNLASDHLPMVIDFSL